MQKRRPQRRGREDALFGDVVFPLERKGVLLKLHQPRAHAAVSAAEERSRGAMRGPCACACAGKAGMAGVVRGMKQHAARKTSFSWRLLPCRLLAGSGMCARDTAMRVCAETHSLNRGMYFLLKIIPFIILSYELLFLAAEIGFQQC